MNTSSSLVHRVAFSYISRRRTKAVVPHHKTTSQLIRIQEYIDVFYPETRQPIVMDIYIHIYDTYICIYVCIYYIYTVYINLKMMMIVWQYLRYMQRCGVAVVKSDSMEILGCDFGVFLHVGPQVRTVFGALAVAEFHTVTPANQLPAQVHVGPCGWNGPVYIKCQVTVQTDLHPRISSY